MKETIRDLAHDLSYGPSGCPEEADSDMRQTTTEILTFSVIGLSPKPKKQLAVFFSLCKKLLEEGKKRIYRALAPDRLESKEVVLPFSLIIFLLHQMTKDGNEWAPSIQSVYFDYMSKLDGEVQKKPYRRAHQERINDLRQEILCVQDVLQKQLEIVETLPQRLRTDFQKYPSIGPSQQEKLRDESSAMLRDRIVNFQNLERHARELAGFNLMRIESNRDRQEGSILVFTIVTIIFLPLSFVSSFFGMNTNDIRELAIPQWIFWVVAVPLTAIVVGISMFLAQKIESVRDTLSDFADRWRSESQ
ncbi:MAG: hypothetical protein Q9174_007266 [Haloplaca sp. 1 TL-2023]